MLKTGTFMFRLISSMMLLTLLASALGVTSARAAGIRYGKPVAAGIGDCSSWANACTLQTALTGAISGDEIWATAGTHKPTAGIDRGATFQLKDGVAIYGGFAGTETSRDQRDFTINVSTLSGEIGTAGNSDNSYHVVSGTNGATLDGFTVTAGNANGGSGCPGSDCGGGMLNDISSPALVNIIFSGNSAFYGGGMFNNTADPALTNVTFSDNSADYGGGMNNYSSSPALTAVTFNGNSAVNIGGGMYNHESSNPTLTNVTFSDNSANLGGGMFNNTNSDPILTTVTFTNNSATDGGGMENQTNSNPTLTDVTFSDNTATYGGGMLNWSSSPILTDVTFSGNSASIYGGGMFNYDNGNPTLTNITFNANTSTDSGGGMCNIASNPTLTNVAFSGNSATSYGGGMYNYSNSSPTLTNVTFSDNTSADYGGGMLNDSGTPILTNVTFSGNSATIYGGGMYNNASSPILTNVTFGGNAADWGGAISNYASSPQIRNTIFWGNMSPNGVQIGQIYNYDAGSTPSVDGGVLQGGCSAGTTCTNSLTTDPKLDALGNYGGFTKTIRLLAGSSAINALPVGMNGCGTTIAADQRGVTRPQGALCDIGAYEEDVAIFQLYTISGNAGSAGVTLNYTDGTPKTVVADGSGLYTITVPYGWSGMVTPTKTDYSFLPSAKPYTNVSANWTAQNYTATAQSPGTFSKARPTNGANNTGWTLGWNQSSYAATYEYCYGLTNPCSNWTSNGNSLGKFLSDLVPGNTYYWQVRARNSIGVTYADSGTNWSFTTNTPPFNFNKLSPAHGVSQLASPVPLLSWETSKGASYYEYCFSMGTSCSNWINAGTSTMQYPSVSLPLTQNTNYAWHVRATNAFGTTYANGGNANYWWIWIVRPPGAFNKSGPSNGSTNQVNPTLSWTLGDTYPPNYEYCYDTTNDNNCTSWISNGTNRSVTLGNLLPATTYYWHVRAGSGVGTTYADASPTAFWSFRTDSTAPTVTSINRFDANPTKAGSVRFTVSFSEAVSGVSSSAPFDDFVLTASPRISGATVTAVSGSGSTRLVTVNTGSGNGTIRLDVPAGATIMDMAGNALSGVLPFVAGQPYTINKPVEVYIGGALQGSYLLAPSESTRQNYAGVDNGPVKVVSTDGMPIIAALRDAWAVNGVTTSFSQLMGLPQELLSDKYVFPGYNNVTLNEQLRIANVDAIQTTVTVTIGGIWRGEYILFPPGSSEGPSAVRINYVDLDSGPVVVEGTPGVNIIAAIREAWSVNGVIKSFVQLMGLPAGQLSNKYVFPAYNNVTLNEQLRIGNVDPANPTTVTVTIGGVVRGTYPLAAGQAVRVNYAGLDSGPVVVEGSPSTVPIISSIRSAWSVNGVITSFAQLMGMPAEQLSNKYLFPAYNNVTVNDQLRIANVDTNPTTVTVKIGGVSRGTYPLAAGAAVRINYAGLDSGPVVVEGMPSTVKIISAIREAWSVSGAIQSFVQLMGLPAGQLSTTYLFPAYNNVTLNEQLRFGVP